MGLDTRAWQDYTKRGGGGGYIHLQTSDVIVLYIFFLSSSQNVSPCGAIIEIEFVTKRSKTDSRGFKLSNPGERLQGGDLLENQFL